jgi:hypothetical protein
MFNLLNVPIQLIALSGPKSVKYAKLIFIYPKVLRLY